MLPIPAVTEGCSENLPVGAGCSDYPFLPAADDHSDFHLPLVQPPVDPNHKNQKGPSDHNVEELDLQVAVLPQQKHG
jgi:hypothetical protein